MEKTWGENGWTEEAEEDRATDELEACVFPLGTKLLSDTVQGILEVTTCKDKTRYFEPVVA